MYACLDWGDRSHTCNIYVSRVVVAVIQLGLGCHTFNMPCRGSCVHIIYTMAIYAIYVISIVYSRIYPFQGKYMNRCGCMCDTFFSHTYIFCLLENSLYVHHSQDRGEKTARGKSVFNFCNIYTYSTI